MHDVVVVVAVVKGQVDTIPWFNGLMVTVEEDSMLYIECILHFMEENPKIDYGMPGPLVHFMEKKYKKGYEKLLLESIKRKPTEHTVWMLNRILNDVNLEERNVYMDVLKAIVKDSKYDEELRSLAKEFLEYQEG